MWQIQLKTDGGRRWHEHLGLHQTVELARAALESGPLDWHQRETWPAPQSSPPADFVYECRCEVCLATWDAVEPGVCPCCLSPCVVDGLALGPGPGLARVCSRCSRVYVKRWTPVEKCYWCRVDLIPA